jgi:2-dehydro-3-deoxyglucarate aldolase/4-hydroxy-2-oxoheptanedioate aldolase
MRSNPVKAQLAAGGFAVGVIAFELPTATSTRIVEPTGADFVVWDLEHTGWTVDTLRPALAAARLAAPWPVVRVPRAEYHLIATALDAGAMGVMAPMVESGEQARLVVDSVKYPPVGRRGFGALYPDQTADGGPAGWMERSNAETLVWLQIETAAAVESAEEIAAVPGVDGLWLGVYDLSISLGVPGDFDDPGYTAAVDRVLAVSQASGVPLGLMLPSGSAAGALLDRGFRMFVLGDVQTFSSALGAGLRALREAAGA